MQVQGASKASSFSPWNLGVSRSVRVSFPVEGVDVINVNIPSHSRHPGGLKAYYIPEIHDSPPEKESPGHNFPW